MDDHQEKALVPDCFTATSLVPRYPARFPKECAWVCRSAPPRPTGCPAARPAPRPRPPAGRRPTLRLPARTGSQGRSGPTVRSGCLDAARGARCRGRWPSDDGVGHPPIQPVLEQDPFRTGNSPIQFHQHFAEPPLRFGHGASPGDPLAPRFALGVASKTDVQLTCAGTALSEAAFHSRYSTEIIGAGGSSRNRLVRSSLLASISIS